MDWILFPLVWVQDNLPLFISFPFTIVYLIFWILLPWGLINAVSETLNENKKEK